MMKNVIVNIPSKGDIVFLDAEKKVRFLEADTYEASSFPGGATIMGVVGWRQGRDVYIIHKTAKDEKWSQGYYWKTSGWKLDNQPHECTITFHSSQKQPSSPILTYQGSSLIEVMAQLLRWFNAYAQEGGPRYNVQGNEDGTIEVILEDYANWYEYTLGISGIDVSYDTGAELPALTDGYAINGKGGYYKGMNWDKFMDYMKTTESGSFNPSEPVESLPTNPVSLPAYLGANCAYLRGIYGEGEDGWKKCLSTYMIQHPTMRGIFGDGYKNGHYNTYLLANQTFQKTSGEIVPKYPAFNFCANIGYDNPAFAKGRWYLPTMDELAKMVKDIKLDYTDIVNRSLAAIGGDKVTFRSLWSCCRSYVGNAWCFNGWNGYADYYYFYTRLSAVALLLYKLSECEK